MYVVVQNSRGVCSADLSSVPCNWELPNACICVRAQKFLWATQQVKRSTWRLEQTARLWTRSTE